MNKICTTCGAVFTHRIGARLSFLTGQCGVCLGTDDKEVLGNFADRIVCGSLTQRELADAKRQLYEAERTLREIETRKQEFLQRATEEANRVVAEIEKQVGKPMKELRQQRDMMAQRLQEYMVETGRTEMMVKDMLVEVKNVVVNRGNAPLWSQITEKMGALIGWSEEELSKFVKANYSVAQMADKLFMTFLPPGERQRRKREKDEQGNITSAYRAEELDIPKIAEIETSFLRTGSRTCRVETPTAVFLLTGGLVRQHGLAHMISLQQLHKKSLRIEDMEQENDVTRVIVTGKAAYDPNSVRAYLAERMPDREIKEVMVIDQTRVAVELGPVAGGTPEQVAQDFFAEIGGIIQEIMLVEKNRQTTVSEMMNSVTAGQADVPDSNVGDLSLTHDRAQPGRGGQGTYGNSPQEGIMSPEGGTPNLSAG